MRKRPFVIFGIFAAICVVAIPFWALQKEGGDEAAASPVASYDKDAQELFVANCGSCHTLSAAGTDGVVGPNLDDVLGQSGGEGESIYAANYPRVLNAVVCGREGRMPRGLVAGEDAKEVSSFVAAYAGRVGAETGPLVPESAREAPEPQPCTDSGGS